MKTLLKIFLVLFVLVLVLVGAGLFILTRPGVQKKLVESQLPEGSSIRTVRVTTSSLELSELKLALPDGRLLEAYYDLVPRERTRYDLRFNTAQKGILRIWMEGQLFEGAWQKPP